jgi:hypothetical protein
MRAVLDYSRWDELGLGVTVEPDTSPATFASVLSGAQQPSGVDAQALAAFRRDKGTKKRVDVSRLSRPTDAGAGQVVHYTFSAIGFDARRERAVVAVSTEGGGSLIALVRTIEGNWALTRTVPLWAN